jgi:hypothetical protein
MFVGDPSSSHRHYSCVGTSLSGPRIKEFASQASTSKFIEVVKAVAESAYLGLAPLTLETPRFGYLP